MRKPRISYAAAGGGASARPAATGRSGLPLLLSAAPLVLALALAACAETQRPPAPLPAPAPMTSKPTLGVPTPPSASPVASPAEASAEAPAETKEAEPEAEEPAPRQIAKAPPPLKPERIMGLTRTELLDLLGKPDFLRRDAPAEIWQYRGKECILDVFLYDSGEYYRVLHFEVRERTAKSVSTGRCFTALLEARKRDAAG